MPQNQKDSPDFQNQAYKTMERAWAIMRDTCAGTLHLRDQGSRYLPIEPAEDTRDFEIRRSRAIFFNAVERTLHGLVGLVFRKEPTLGDDVPEASASTCDLTVSTSIEDFGAPRRQVGPPQVSPAGVRKDAPCAHLTRLASVVGWRIMEATGGPL